MFRLRETGCDGHVHLYGYCDRLRPESLLERFEAKRGKLSHVVVQRKQLCSDEVDE